MQSRCARILVRQPKILTVERLCKPLQRINGIERGIARRCVALMLVHFGQRAQVLDLVLYSVRHLFHGHFVRHHLKL